MSCHVMIKVMKLYKDTHVMSLEQKKITNNLAKVIGIIWLVFYSLGEFLTHAQLLNATVL